MAIVEICLPLPNETAGCPPTEDEIYRAAIKWCGEKERETFSEDITYFKHNWHVMAGARAYVEREIVAAGQRP